MIWKQSKASAMLCYFAVAAKYHEAGAYWYQMVKNDIHYMYHTESTMSSSCLSKIIETEKESGEYLLVPIFSSNGNDSTIIKDKKNSNLINSLDLVSLW